MEYDEISYFSVSQKEYCRFKCSMMQTTEITHTHKLECYNLPRKKVVKLVT